MYGGKMDETTMAWVTARSMQNARPAILSSFARMHTGKSCPLRMLYVFYRVNDSHDVELPMAVLFLTMKKPLAIRPEACNSLGSKEQILTFGELRCATSRFKNAYFTFVN